MKADRVQIYKNALDRQPDCAAAVRQAGAQDGLPPYAGLYLHTFAPIIVKFAGWVLDEAAKSGKKRLYFLSRDGYQPYLAASRLAKQRGVEIECRYLHVSRYSLRVPAYHLNIKRALEQICTDGIDVTLKKLLKRGALTDAECAEITGRLACEEDYPHILGRRHIKRVKQALAKEKLFLRYVKKHSKESYADAMGYLAQEGLLSDVPYAIVDSGWVGTLQQSLQLLLRTKKPEFCVEGYYFGLYEIPADAAQDAYHAYYFSPKAGLYRKARFSNSLFEALCSADEGMTLGYYKENGRFLARQAPSGSPNSRKQQENLKAFRLFLEYYADGGIADKQKADSLMADKQKADSLMAGKQKADSLMAGKWKADNRKADAGRRMAEELFTALMSDPTGYEVSCFGGFWFSDDVREAGYNRLAAELTEEEIRNCHILRRLCMMAVPVKEGIRESAWIEGSIVKSAARRKKGGSRYRKRELFQARLQKYLIYARKQIEAKNR